ncbi:hypothetical protein FRC12_003497 [Ceratobasidium sp. 428]|nr:hypothetical protein FRC12_003497 [Ceratobasidium sp. 428]
MPEDSSRIAYFTLQIFGFVSLPLLAATLIFCPSIKRHPTLANNALIWMFSSLVGCLLLFTKNLSGPEPPAKLCQAQSALMLSSPSGVSVAALVIVWKVWNQSRRIQLNSEAKGEPLWLTCTLLGAPYVIWGILAAIFAALQSNSVVYRSLFYCISSNQTLGMVSGVLAAVFLILCLVFQVWTIILVYQRFQKSRRFSRAEVGDIPVPFFVRIMSFMLLVFLGLILSLVATWAFTLEVPDLIFASIGVLMFFIFASQEDVLVAWKLMRPRARATDSGATDYNHPDPRNTVYSTHVRSPPSPTSSVGLSLEHSHVSSAFDLRSAAKQDHHLSMQSDPIELSPTTAQSFQV